MNANDLPKDIAQTAIQQDLMSAVRAIARGPLAKRAHERPPGPTWQAR